MVPANRVLNTLLELKRSETCRLHFVSRKAVRTKATRFTVGGLFISTSAEYFLYNLRRQLKLYSFLAYSQFVHARLQGRALHAYTFPHWLV